MPTQTALNLDDLKFLSTGPLGDGLHYLSRLAATIPPQGDILEWGIKALHLTPGNVRPWFTRAWWGAAAARLVTERIRLEQADDVMSLLLPVDMSPLERALEGGRGVILTTSHLGPWLFAKIFLQRIPHPVLILALHPSRRQQNFRIYDISETIARRKSFATGLLHLRDNGVLVAAGDGEFGETLHSRRFLNHDLQFRTGLPTLARLTGAPTIWMFVLWEPQGRGLQVLFEDSGLDPTSDPETWEDRWLDAYTARLASVMVSRPESLVFYGGLWSAFQGGFFSEPPPPRVWRPQEEDDDA